MPGRRRISKTRRMKMGGEGFFDSLKSSMSSFGSKPTTSQSTFQPSFPTMSQQEQYEYSRWPVSDNTNTLQGTMPKQDYVAQNQLAFESQPPSSSPFTPGVGFTGRSVRRAPLRRPVGSAWGMGGSRRRKSKSTKKRSSKRKTAKRG